MCNRFPVLAADMKNYTCIYANFLTSLVILTYRSAEHSENLSNTKVGYLGYGVTPIYSCS